MKVASFVLMVCPSVVLIASGLDLFLTRSTDEDGVRGSIGLGLMGVGVFLLVVFRRLGRAQKS
jgi:hypothetical protein